MAAATVKPLQTKFVEFQDFQYRLSGLVTKPVPEANAAINRLSKQFAKWLAPTERSDKFRIAFNNTVQRLGIDACKLLPIKNQTSSGIDQKPQNFETFQDELADALINPPELARNELLTIKKNYESELIAGELSARYQAAFNIAGREAGLLKADLYEEKILEGDGKNTGELTAFRRNRASRPTGGFTNQFASDVSKLSKEEAEQLLAKVSQSVAAEGAQPQASSTPPALSTAESAAAGNSSSSSWTFGGAAWSVLTFIPRVIASGAQALYASLPNMSFRQKEELKEALEQRLASEAAQEVAKS